MLAKGEPFRALDKFVAEAESPHRGAIRCLVANRVATRFAIARELILGAANLRAAMLHRLNPQRVAAGRIVRKIADVYRSIEWSVRSLGKSVPKFNSRRTVQSDADRGRRIENGTGECQIGFSVVF